MGLDEQGGGGRADPKLRERLLELHWPTMTRSYTLRECWDS